MVYDLLYIIIPEFCAIKYCSKSTLQHPFLIFCKFIRLIYNLNIFVNHKSHIFRFFRILLQYIFKQFQDFIHIGIITISLSPTSRLDFSSIVHQLLIDDFERTNQF